MDWSRAVDGYCERLAPGLWAEPVNLLTNIAFLGAAVVMRRRVRDATGRALCGLLFAIGLGSALFHSVATAWAALADVLPIAGFVLLYLYAANRDFLGWGRVRAAFGTLAFLPFSAALVPLFAALPGFRLSAVYWPVPLLIALYALLLRARAPATARGLAAGAALLALSLLARSLDGPLCAALPLGTHWLWHLLNAAMLGWMIELRQRHIAADA